ncbi:hypothetical protein [Geobacter sp.]|uniref:hypothetical protein n=1 Tax=Geobacter sp. TaxID=46610 RepID=UPI0027BA5B85|nr:hypothetical protein [Geobacter sp.]
MSTLPVAKVELSKNLSVHDAISESINEYATRLVELIKKRFGGTLKSIDHSQLVIGIAWPGPVREDRPNGTSGLLKAFGLSNIIAENKIDDIWEVDIAGAVARAWKKEFKKSSPFVSLLNDGDAEAAGAVVLAKDNPTRGLALSVVKLGTGLAGAILKTYGGGLSLVPGLYEWGKLVLDVAAPPKPGFPNGVAGEYLSQKCLPRLAGRRGEGQFFQQRDNPESAEIGLILETEAATENKQVKAYQALRVECGSILGYRRSMYGVPVSAEVLRVVYNAPDSDPDLLFEVRLALRAFAGAKDLLVKQLEEYGRIRLHRMICCETTGSNDKKEVKNLCKDPNFKKASDIAKRCAESLGRYLGDFCVLLHDELDVNAVRLTGGVLSGETGKVAIDSARNRIQLYGLSMQKTTTGAYAICTPNNQNVTCLGKRDAEKSSNAGKQDDAGNENVDRGTLGAACFAAASFIKDKKQKGLQKLRSQLLEVKPGERVDVRGQKISVPGVYPDPDFGEYALSEKELLDFMENRGPDWGYYQDSGQNSFVRWK